MGIFDLLFGKKLFKPKNDDVKMRPLSRAQRQCNCLEPQYGNGRFGKLVLHSDIQDINCEAWKMLEGLIETAAAKRSKEFSPGLEMPPELWVQITTLPPSIAKLTSVKRLYLYASNLVQIPVEIGAMESLEELDVYTSYRLHWLPYEVTRCRKLKRSRASTRALYGNYKYRPPFPKLGADSLNTIGNTGACSVCRGKLDRNFAHQVWISLLVATDVFPLLVNACSDECIGRLPKPASGYVDQPHTGGLEVKQPPASHCVDVVPSTNPNGIP